MLAHPSGSRGAGGAKSEAQRGAAAPAEYFSAWADASSLPMMILTADHKILWSNGVAIKMVAKAEDFQSMAGNLSCVDKVQDPAFRDFIAGLGDEPQAWVMHTPHEDRYLIVRAERVAPPGRPLVITVVVYSTSSDTHHVWADIGQVFNLTKSEVVIVKKMFHGASADQIADRLKISVETVRTHVRRVYAKMGVGNREQLFSIVNGFRVS